MTHCLLLLLLEWWAHWDASRPAGWGEPWRSLIKIGVSFCRQILGECVIGVTKCSWRQRTFEQPTYNRQPVVDVTGFEAEVVLFPGGIDAITAFKDHLNSAFLLLQIPAQQVIPVLLRYNTTRILDRSPLVNALRKANRTEYRPTTTTATN